MIKGFKLEKQILEESLLKSSFTFGFELEAVAKASYYSDYDSSDDEGYYDDEEEDHYVESSEMSREIDDRLQDLLNKNQTEILSGTMQSDGSLEPDDDDDFCFEWASPVMDYTPKNVQRTINFLDSLSDIGIYTNNSCGFHHHLSWKGINERDMIWTYTNLIMDEDFVNSMIFLQTRRGDPIKMDSHWAKLGPLEDLRNAIKTKNWVKALNYYNDDKYRLFRIHPYGTIEWRGPRKFLNYENLEYIKDFYKKFNTLITKVIKCQEMKTIDGTNITKQEFFKNLKNAQNSPDAPHPDNDMRDNMEFLYRTGTYRGDRRIRLKRDTTDKTSYLSEKHLRALANKPELLYNEILKCKDLESFAKIIRVNEMAWVFYQLSQKIVPEKDKAFLDKLLDIALLITDDISEMKSFLGSNMVDLLDTKKLYDKYKAIIAKTKDCNALINFVNYMSEENIKMSFNEFFSLLRKYAKEGDNPALLSSNCEAFTNYAIRNSYSDKELFNIVNLILKIQFKSGSSLFVAHSIVNILSKVLTTEKEIDKWDENILGAMFEKRLPHFLAYILPTKNENILKGIVAIIRSGETNSRFLCDNLKNTLKNWID